MVKLNFSNNQISPHSGNDETNCMDGWEEDQIDFAILVMFCNMKIQF